MARAAGGRRPIPVERKLLSMPTGHKLRDDSNAHRVTGQRGEAVPAFVPGTVPNTPSALKVGNPGRRYWKMYWQYGKTWLSSADYPVVLRLCVLQDLADRILKAIESDGLFQVAERSGLSHTHPMLTQFNQMIANIDRLECSLGLNPVERSRIRVNVKEEETSLDAWRRSRTQPT